MSRIFFSFPFVAAAACATAVLACGGISDPTKSGETVATVSGSLTGTSVPDGAHVALVWRTAASSASEGGYAVGDDVPVVGGKFTISLEVPASAYFSSLDSSTSFSTESSGGSTVGSSTSGSSATPPSTGTGGTSTSSTSSSGSTTSSSSGGSSSGMAQQVKTQDEASGDVITQPLTAAVAGFVVYQDTNGNGKLDLSGQYASSTDTILGGSSSLVLVYLKDGGALDYEKLRDKSGILPTAGFDLAWVDNSRWLPLNEVELTLDPSEGLPSPVCSTSGIYSGTSDGSIDPVATSSGSSSSSSGSSGSSGLPVEVDGGTSTEPTSIYPSPTDPDLTCSADGTSFVYTYPATPCPTPTPAPTGLCAEDVPTDAIACAPGGYSYTTTLPTDAPIPDGWPCTVTSSADGGTDASAKDGGSADGG